MAMDNKFGDGNTYQQYTKWFSIVWQTDLLDQLFILH